MKPKDHLLSVLLTLSLSLTLTLCAHWLYWPHRPLWMASGAKSSLTSIELSHVLGHLRKDDALFLDPRPVSEFREGHLPKAFSFPPSAEPTAYLTEQLGLAKPIVIICADGGCDSAYELARELAAEGYGKLSVFPGGMRQWRSAGLPLQTAAGEK